MTTLKDLVTVATFAVVLGSRLPATAGITTTDFATSDGSTFLAGSASGSQVIPDNTPAGVAYAMNLNTLGVPYSLASISVTLNLSGGYNGDIYAYLSHGSQISYLLNANAALSGSGMNLTFVEGTGSAIPTGGSGTLTGSYTANTDLATFNNTDPNGNWTLFFADLSPGDTSTLTSFSLDITAVPEPVNVALGAFGVMFTVGGGIRWYRRQSKTAAV